MLSEGLARAKLRSVDSNLKWFIWNESSVTEEMLSLLRHLSIGQVGGTRHSIHLASCRGSTPNTHIIPCWEPQCQKPAGWDESWWQIFRQKCQQLKVQSICSDCTWWILMAIQFVGIRMFFLRQSFCQAMQRKGNVVWKKRFVKLCLFQHVCSAFFFFWGIPTDRACRQAIFDAMLGALGGLEKLPFIFVLAGLDMGARKWVARGFRWGFRWGWEHR